MQCNEIENLLETYLDDEMTLSDRRMIESHITSCEACNAKLNEHKVLQEAIFNLGEESVPYSLRRSVDTQIKALTDKEPSSEKWKWWSFSAAGMVMSSVLTAVVLIFGTGLPVERDINDPFVNAHIRSLMVNHITDVTSTDKHTVKPWFSGKLPFSPSVHQLKMKQLKLIGGRLDFVSDKPTASIVYKLREHVINVFVQRSEIKQGQLFIQMANKSSYNIATWRKDGLDYRAISDLNKRELEIFSEKLAEK